MGGFTSAPTKRQAKMQQEYDSAQTQSQINQMRLQQAIGEKGRQERLNQAMASKRAAFGASGIGSGGGSAGALLQGLVSRAANQNQGIRELNDMRIQDINNQFAHRRRVNLLQAANARRRKMVGLAETGISQVPYLGQAYQIYKNFS